MIKGRISRRKAHRQCSTTALTCFSPASNASRAFFSQGSGAFWGRIGRRLVIWLASHTRRWSNRRWSA